ncbi:hypothetical protein BOX15_Mlig006167g2, partial [Macrostomum lignano]
FYILDFGGQFVEYAPEAWMIGLRTCQWPRVSNERLKVLRSKGSIPETDWETHSCTILSKCDNEVTARRRCKKAEAGQDELTTDAEQPRRRSQTSRFVEEVPPESRRRRLSSDSADSGTATTKRKRSSSKRSQPTPSVRSDSESGSESGSETAMPPPFPGQPATHPQSNGSTGCGTPTPADCHVLTTEQSRESSTGGAMAASITTPSRPSKAASTPAVASMIMTPRHTLDSAQSSANMGLSRFEVKVLRELASIRETVEVITRKLSVISNGLHQQDLPDIPHCLPVKSMEQMDSLLEWLGDKKHEKLMAQKLAHVGGKDARELIRRMLRNVVAAEVLLQFNFTGVGPKKAFKNTTLHRVVVRAARLGNTMFTDKEIDDSIAHSLMHAGDILRKHDKSK